MFGGVGGGEFDVVDCWEGGELFGGGQEVDEAVEGCAGHYVDEEAVKGVSIRLFGL